MSTEQAEKQTDAIQQQTSKEAWEKRVRAMLKYWEGMGKKLAWNPPRTYTNKYAPVDDTWKIYSFETPALMVSGNFLTNYGHKPNLLVTMPREIGVAFINRAMKIAGDTGTAWAPGVLKQLKTGVYRDPAESDPLWTMLAFAASELECGKNGLPYYEDQSDPNAVWLMKVKGPFDAEKAHDFVASYGRDKLSAEDFAAGSLFRAFIDMKAYGKSTGAFHGVAASLANNAPHMDFLHLDTLESSPFYSSRAADYSELPDDTSKLFDGLSPDSVDAAGDAAPRTQGGIDNPDDILV